VPRRACTHTLTITGGAVTCSMTAGDVTSTYTGLVPFTAVWHMDVVA